MASPRLAARDTNISVRKKRVEADENRFLMQAVRAKQSAEANARQSFGETARATRSFVIVSEYGDDIDEDNEDHQDDHDPGSGGDDDDSSLGSFLGEDEARHHINLKDSTSDNAPCSSSLGDLEGGPASDSTSCPSPPPEEQQQLSQRERAEAAACNAFSGAGCVMGTEIALSDADEDDAASLFDDGVFVDGEDAIIAMHDEDIARESQGAKDTFTSPPATTLEEKAIGKVDAEEAVAHSLFADTALVSGAEVVLSDCDSENEDAQGVSIDADAGLVASAEVIGFSDGDDDDEADAIDALHQDERDAQVMIQGFEVALTTADGFHSPPPPDKVPQMNDTEPKNSTTIGTSTRTGSASATSSGRTSGEGFEHGTCFQPSALLPKSSALLDDTAPMTPPAPLLLRPLSPPPQSSPSPQPRTLASSGTGDNIIKSESLPTITGPPPALASLNGTTSPPSPPPPLSQPPPVAQKPRIMTSPQPDIPRAGGYIEPEHLHLFVGFPPVAAEQNEIPLPPSPQSPPSPSPSLVQRPLSISSTQSVIPGAGTAVEPVHLAAIDNETPALLSSPSPVVHGALTPSPPPNTLGEGDSAGYGRAPTCTGPSQTPAQLESTPSVSPSPPPPPAQPLSVVQRATLASSSPLTASSQAALSSSSPSPPPPPPAPVSSPRTPSFNALKGMFSPQMDTASFASSLGDVLYRGGILQVSAKSRRALKAAGKGEATTSVMEDVIRGMNSSHGKKNLARDNGGATFVGPKTRTPSYKTGKGLTRLLSEISKRHEVGTQFVVCLDAPHPGTKAHVIAGVVSKLDMPTLVEAEVASAWGSPLPLSSTEALIHGDGGEMTVDQWVEVNGDIGEGQRLSAWVY